MKLTKILAILLLVLAVSLALLAWMLSREAPRAIQPVALPSETVQPLETTQTAPAARFTVVVARQAITAGQRITEADLQVVEKAEAVAEAYAQAAPLLGRTTLIALQPEQIILEHHIVTGLSLQLENGQRAVSIAVKEPMAAGNHIRPGDFVDVFFTVQEDGKDTKVDTQTRLLLARARVLAYGAGTVENPPATLAQRKAEQAKENSQRNSREEARGRAEVANAAVLAVPLVDVQRLTLAEKYGQLSLALRHPDDLELPNADLFAALPFALRPILNKDGGSGISDIDKAYAGLKLADLADGRGAAKEKSRSVDRSAAGTNTKRTLELINENSAKTVSY